jgi:hypothetical protein
MVVPCGIVRSACHTLLWNDVPVVSTGSVSMTATLPVKYSRIAVVSPPGSREGRRV